MPKFRLGWLVLSLLLLPSLAVAQSADQAITVTDSPDPVTPGNNVTYTITVTNNGPNPAVNGGFNTSLPGELIYQSASAPAGFTCSTFGAAVSCTNPSFALGTANFTLIAQVAPSLANFPDGSFSTLFTTSGTTSDPVGGNNSQNVTTSYNTAQINLSTTVTDSPDPVTPDNNITYTVTVANAGPDAATNVNFNSFNNGSLRFQSLTEPAGWNCTEPAVNAAPTFTCTAATFGVTNAVFTVVVRADSAVLGINDGTVSTVFSANGTGNETNTANNSEQEDTAYVTPDANLSISVTDSPDPVTPNNDITYTVTVMNLGPDTATNTNFNVFNSGTLRFQSVTPGTGFTCSSPPPVGGTPTFTCTNPSFANGATATFTVVVRADPAVLGINDGSVQTVFSINSSNVTDPNNANNSETETTGYVTPDADIAITATDSPDPVGPDGDITYTVTVTNNGPDAATNVNMNVPLNNTLRVTSVTAPAGFNCGSVPVGSGASFTCTNPSMAASTNGVFTIVLRANDEQFGINDTTIVQNFNANSAVADPVSGNNSVNVSTAYVTPDADVSITATDSPDPVGPDGDITYTVTVRNNGPDAAPNVNMNVPLNNTLRVTSVTAPAGFNCGSVPVGSGASFTCTNPSLAASTNAVFTIVLRANDEQFGILDQTIVQNFNATSSVADPNNANNSVNVSTQYVAPDADVSITNADTPDPVTSGGTITYTQNFGNAGPDAAPNVVVSQSVPAGTTFQSLIAPAAFTCTTPAVGGTGTINCTATSLPNGSAGTFTLVVNVTAASGTITSTVNVTSSIADPDNTDNSATTTTTVLAASADLSIAKTTAATSAVRNTNITYTITLTNAGPNAAANVVVTDVLPATLLFQSIQAPAGFTCTTPAVGASGTITCNAATLANGATATFTLVARVSNTATGTIANSASVSSTTTDPNGGNSSGTTPPLAVGGGGEDIPTMPEWMLFGMAAVLAVVAAMKLRS